MKRGQIKLSFGMIFSIILIVVFLGFAIYVIMLLLHSQEHSLVLLFKDSLQDDVDKMWRGSGSLTNPDGYTLPKKVEQVCFVDYGMPQKGQNQELYRKLKQVYYEFENVIFYPVGSAEGLDAFELKHIDIEKVTQHENPYCIENKDGKVTLTIKRDYNEELVFIQR